MSVQSVSFAKKQASCMLVELICWDWGLGCDVDEQPGLDFSSHVVHPYHSPARTTLP